MLDIKEIWAGDKAGEGFLGRTLRQTLVIPASLGKRQRDLVINELRNSFQFRKPFAVPG